MVHARSFPASLKINFVGIYDKAYSRIEKEKTKRVSKFPVICIRLLVRIM